MAWIEKYVRQVREQLCPDPQKERALFLTKDGQVFSGSRMCLLVTGYLRQAEVRKSGSCHLLRHTMATLMLENGADIRFIQAMLGHAKLDTTQIYTQVSIRKLKEIHRATHPAKAKSPRSERSPEEPDPKGGGEAPRDAESDTDGQGDGEAG